MYSPAWWMNKARKNLKQMVKVLFGKCSMSILDQSPTVTNLGKMLQLPRWFIYFQMISLSIIVEHQTNFFSCTVCSSADACHNPEVCTYSMTAAQHKEYSGFGTGTWATRMHRHRFVEIIIVTSMASRAYTIVACHVAEVRGLRQLIVISTVAYASGN